MLEEQFFRILFEKMNAVEQLMPVMTLAADAVIDAVTHGGCFYVYDENGQMNQESNYRCSGLKLPRNGNAGDGTLVDVTALDVVIVYSLLPVTGKSLKAIEKAKSAGAYTIAVCPKTVDTKKSGSTDLASTAHIHIDDLSDAYGVVHPSGWTKSIAPTTGIMNDLILWCLHGVIIDRMIMRGMTPGVLRGAHLSGGRVYNHTVVDSLFSERGW